jgi:D-alanyl-D-alanine carboxypeptidase
MTSGGVEAVAVASAEQQVPPPIVPEIAAPLDGWVVQIGAAPSETGANSLLSQAASSISSLSGFRPYVERIEKNGQVFFRARFTGFNDRDAANAMCNELKKIKMSCLAMQS